jgi:hypothetical protein
MLFSRRRVGTGLDEEHALISDLGQATGQHTAGRSPADDNHIVERRCLFLVTCHALVTRGRPSGVVEVARELPVGDWRFLQRGFRGCDGLGEIRPFFGFDNGKVLHEGAPESLHGLR